MIKEATATAFVFRRAQRDEAARESERRAGWEAGWELVMIWHPRFEEWMPPCGHVEADESAAEAAVRETLEEAGCRVRLVAGSAMSLPAGFPHPSVTSPWWILEMAAGPDNHTRERHVHIDHVFVGLWDGAAQCPETQVRWFTEAELADEPGIAEDSRLQAQALFAAIDDIVAAAEAGQAAGTR